METLTKNNVPIEFLDNIKAYIDNPAYSWIFKLLKKDKNTALKGIEAVKQYLSNNKTDTKLSAPMNLNCQMNQTPSDDLDKFKRGLSRLK